MVGPVYLPNQPKSPVVVLKIVYQRDSHALSWESTHMVKDLLLAVIAAAKEWVLSKHYIGAKVDTPRNVVFTVACELGVEPVIEAPMWNKDLALAMLEDTEKGVRAYFDHRTKGISEGMAIGEEQFDYAKWYRAQEAKA